MSTEENKALMNQIPLSRVADGKLVEHWASIDQLDMLQRLGVIPAPGQG